MQQTRLLKRNLIFIHHQEFLKSQANIRLTVWYRVSNQVQKMLESLLNSLEIFLLKNCLTRLKIRIWKLTAKDIVMPRLQNGGKLSLMLHMPEQLHIQRHCKNIMLQETKLQTMEKSKGKALKSREQHIKKSWKKSRKSVRKNWKHRRKQRQRNNRLLLQSFRTR